MTGQCKHTPELCHDHLNFTDGTCPDCKLPVDTYGNTEDQFDNCSYPDCGCDGARLCMAKSGASDFAGRSNIEGMWSGKTRQQRNGVFSLMKHIGGKK